MEQHDRIVARPRIKKIPEHWLFKTSEGVMGPFDTREIAQSTLKLYVAKCMEDVRSAVIGNH